MSFVYCCLLLILVVCVFALGPFVCVLLFSMQRNFVRDFLLSLAVAIFKLTWANSKLKLACIIAHHLSSVLRPFVRPSVVLSVRRKLQHFLHLLCNRCTEVHETLYTAICASYEIHVKFIWNLRKSLHEIYVKWARTWNLHEKFHMKFMWNFLNEFHINSI